MAEQDSKTPDDAERGYLIQLAAWLLSPESSRAIDSLEENTHIGRNQFAKAQGDMREVFRLKAIEIRQFVDSRAAIGAAL